MPVDCKGGGCSTGTVAPCSATPGSSPARPTQGVLARHSEFQTTSHPCVPSSSVLFPSIPRLPIASSPSLATNPHCVAQYSPVEVGFRDCWTPSNPIYFWTRPPPLGSSRPYLSAVAAVCLPHHFNLCLSLSIFNSNSSSITKQPLDGQRLVALVGRGLETFPPAPELHALASLVCVHSLLSPRYRFMSPVNRKPSQTPQLTNQPYI